MEKPGDEGLRHDSDGLGELTEAVGRNFGWHGPGDEDYGEGLPGDEKVAWMD